MDNGENGTATHQPMTISKTETYGTAQKSNLSNFGNQTQNAMKLLYVCGIKSRIQSCKFFFKISIFSGAT